MDDHPVGSHPACGPTGGDDVTDGFLLAFQVGVGQVNKVRGVEGEGDSGLYSGQADPAGGFLADVDALAALIFVTVQPLLSDPAGGFL